MISCIPFFFRVKFTIHSNKNDITFANNNRSHAKRWKIWLNRSPFPAIFHRISRSRSLLLCRVKNKIRKEKKGGKEKDECGIIAQIENTYTERNALTFHSRRPRYFYPSPLTPDPLFLPSRMNEPSKISNRRKTW